MKKRFDWAPPQFGEKKEGEVECYAVAIGNLPMPPFIPRKIKDAIAWIQTLDGFCGFYPYYPHGTLCIFRTENRAKIARNRMQVEKKIQCGDNITKVYVNREFIPEGMS